MTEQEKRNRVREQARHLYAMIQSENSDKSMLINELARLMSSVDSTNFIKGLVNFATGEVLAYHQINVTDTFAEALQEAFHASENSEDVEDGA